MEHLSCSLKDQLGEGEAEELLGGTPGRVNSLCKGPKAERSRALLEAWWQATQAVLRIWVSRHLAGSVSGSCDS